MTRTCPTELVHGLMGLAGDRGMDTGCLGSSVQG